MDLGRPRRWAGAIAVGLVASLFVPGLAFAGPPDDMLMAQEGNYEFELPPISVVLPDVDEGGTTCRYDLTGSGRVRRASGSRFATESGSVEGFTTCSKNLTSVLTIQDSATAATGYVSQCQDTGYKSSKCSATQSVAYFDAAGTLVRPVSTINFRYRLLTGARQRVCFDYKVMMVGGMPTAPEAGPCPTTAI